MNDTDSSFACFENKPDARPNIPNTQKFYQFCFVVIIILGATALTFSHVFLSPSGELSGRFDIYRYYAPLTFFNDICIHSGEWPLWNPLTYCGMPNAGNPQSFIFYPPYIIRSLILGTPTPYNSQASLVIMMGLHFIAIGVFTFLLARDHGLSWPASLTSAFGFTFSALIVRRACEYHYITALAWFPLALLCTKRSIEASNTRVTVRYVVLTGLLMGLSILSGFLQVINIMAMMLLSYSLLYSMSGRHCETRKRLKMGFRGICIVGASLIIACAIAAPLLHSVWELTQFTERRPGLITPKFSDLFTWDMKRFYQSYVVFAGMKYESETLRNFGVVGLVLAALALAHPNKRLVLVWGVIYLILFESSFGPPFPCGTLLEKVTPFALSAYSRAYDFALLPLALLAGFGVDALVSNRAALLRCLIVGYVGCATLIPLYVWTNPHPYLSVSICVVIIPVAAMCLLFLVSCSRPRWRGIGWVMMAFPLLVFGEEFSWNKHFVPWLTKSQFREIAPIRSGLTDLPKDNVRDADPISNRFMFSLRASMNGVEPLYMQRVKDLLNAGDREKHPFRRVNNWEVTRDNQRGNLLFKRRVWLARQYIAGKLLDKQGMFPPTTTTFLENARGVEIPITSIDSVLGNCISNEARRSDVSFVGKGSEISTKRTYRMEFTLPNSDGPASVVHSALCLEYRSTCSTRVDSWLEEPEQIRSTWGKRYDIKPTADATGRVVIPLPDYPHVKANLHVLPNGRGTFQLLNAYVLSDMADEDPLISIRQMRANQMVMDVGPLPGPRILTLLDSNYPGWKVLVDAEEAVLLNACNEFKAVALPAGRHTIEFRYQPVDFWQYLTISLTTLIIAGAALAWTRPAMK